MSSLLTQLGQKTKVELDKKLALAGGTMTGALTLSGAPTASLHAATKAYVDSVSSTASGLQTELDATQSGAGLGTDGSYSANGSTNYLGSVASLKAADEALDSQLKSVADAVSSNDSDISSLQSSVSTNSSDISTLQSNVSSNDSDISTLQSNVSTAQSDITSLESDVSTLQSNVSSNDSDISTLQSNVSSNDSDISALQTQAGSLASDGNSASFSGNISAANATFSGNLTVNGTTTSVNTTNIDVADSIMNLSKGAGSGTNASNDGGFIVERGSSESNVALVWDEGEDKFAVYTTSATAAATDISSTDGSAALADFDANLYHNGVELGTVSEFEAALS
jgi:peptidoglycan hydrolase CwlO-like protein